MNSPSPADRVEAALTPPWGPRLDHFLAARDEMKRPAPAQAPDTFRQEYVFQGDWHPDSDGFLAPDPNGPRPVEAGNIGTCSDLPAVMEAEVLPPAEADGCGATPAVALVPEVLPIRRIPLGGFTVDMWDPALAAAARESAPEYPDLPQKGRSPKAYHHQFQPGEGRRETAPSRTTRDAARKKRKQKK